MEFIMNFKIPATSPTPFPNTHSNMHTLNELKSQMYRKLMEFLNSYFLFNFSNKSRTLQTCTLPISQFTLLRPI